MASHLRVDLTLLQDTTQALRFLHGEFAGAGSVVDANHAALGARDLTSALDDFATNWKHHKHSLLASIEAIEKMATASHDTYVKVDGQLAHDLVGAKPNSHRPAGVTSGGGR